MAVQVWFLEFGLLEAQNVLSVISGCQKKIPYRDIRRTLELDDVHMIEWSIYVF